MPHCDMFCDGKPKAGATVTARGRRVTLFEREKQPGSFRRGDPNAGVADFATDQDLAIALPEQTGLDADISAQTENLLASVEQLLAQAGSDKSHLLMATIYLSDMADYDAMNAVWDAWVPEGYAPTRACVEAKLSHAKYRVEIALTAAVVQG